MKAVSFVLTPPDGSRPAYGIFGAETGVTRKRIYHLDVLEDGTLVFLGRLRGDLERAETLLGERSDVLGYSISDREDGSGLAYVHARPPAEIGQFLALPRTHEVSIDFPIEGTDDGGLRVVLAGETDEILHRALDAIPSEFDVAIERTGAYPEGFSDLTELLTARQREVLSVALDLGYYDVPRDATHRDIADRMGLSVGTVGEHLQKIEARIFGGIDA